jgi:hypothetical protein
VALGLALRVASHNWKLREQAILEEARVHYGRLSAAVVQPGLFDRRAQRLAARHRDSLEAVEASCNRRLSELHALSSITVGEPTCLFALLRE